MKTNATTPTVWEPKPTPREALIWAAIGLEGPAPTNDAEAKDRQVAAVLRELAEKLA